MQKTDSKQADLKMSQVREILIAASTIPSHHAMGFRTDTKITKLSVLAQEVIEYQIGIDLKKIDEDIKSQVVAIKKEILGQEDFEVDLSEEERASLTNKLRKEIMASAAIKELKKKEDELWGQELKENPFEPIEVEDREYADNLKGEKPFNIYNLSGNVDGYTALMTLVAFDLIKIKE